MKTTFIALLLATLFLSPFAHSVAGSNSGSDSMSSGSSSNTSLARLQVKIRILTAEEVGQMALPQSTWMTITTPESVTSADYKILDIQGKVLNRGVLESGKARLDISSLKTGNYLVVIGEAGNRTIQPVQIL